MGDHDTPLDCDHVRQRLHELRRARLPAAERDAVVRHLAGCDRCRREDEGEALLDRLLLERLPQERIPAGLRARLETIVRESEGPSGVGGLTARAHPPRRGAWTVARGLAALAAAAALVLGGAVWGRLSGARRGEARGLAEEAVGDHLRVLASAHPWDLESSASHEVKPWFEGRLDFAPNVPHDVGGLQLRGGSVGYFLDRKAAVISYTLRRHVVTLIAFPASGLAWPEAVAGPDAAGRPVTLRGLHVFLWRHGDVGYALVADVGVEELGRVSRELARATAD